MGPSGPRTPLGGLKGRERKVVLVSKSQPNNQSEKPPGLLQHVLTVLVFWSWSLLLPRLPPRSQGLRLFPWASSLLYGPLEIAWICCPQLPHHPRKNGTHSTCFYSPGGRGTCRNNPACVRLWTGQAPPLHANHPWMPETPDASLESTKTEKVQIML